MEQTKDTICKADTRDISGDGTFISAVTSFSPQFTLRDEALAIAKKMVFPVTEDTFFVLIPISGGVDIASQEGHSEFVGTHQLLSFFCKAGTNFILFNPFPDDHVNVMLASYKGTVFSLETGFHKSQFSLEARNSLQVLDTNGPRMAMGVFDNREKGSFEVSGPLFAFVVNGTFEFGERLLESRDALLIPEIENVQFEALSDDAILLLAEMPV